MALLEPSACGIMARMVSLTDNQLKIITDALARYR
jgi:hypothetical protein